MQEILSKSDDPKVPLCNQEFYELRLNDSESGGKPAYYVREAHAEWSDVDREVMWDKEQVKVFVTHEEAKAHYAARRLALAEQGFIYSDMDM